MRLLVRAVGKFCDLGERRAETKLFRQSPLRRTRRRLARAWVAAAGVRPTARKVILLRGPSLQQQLIMRIGNQNGERAMQLPIAMGGELAA